MNMKATAKLFLIAGLLAGAAIPAIAGPGPQYWQTLNKKSQFEALKPGDKIAYVCNQCQAVVEKTITDQKEAMDHCKEGATIMCPSCKAKVRVVVKGPPKNPMPVREVTYVNEKGEVCFFVAKVVAEKPAATEPATEHHH
jgi:DNA-directed RNA polymerase subunit RPC12/RpoP